MGAGLALPQLGHPLMPGCPLLLALEVQQQALHNRSALVRSEPRATCLSRLLFFTDMRCDYLRMPSLQAAGLDTPVYNKVPCTRQC